MLIGMAIIGCSFVYTVIISILYFSKARVKNFETNVYNILLILAMINMLIEFNLCTNVLLDINVNSFYNMFLNRLFLVTMFSWITIFTIYTFKISFGNNEKYQKLFCRKGLGSVLFGILVLIALLLILILPISQFKDGTFSYSYGPATDCLIVVYALYFCSWFIALFFRTNKNGYIKYFPLFFFVALCGIALILRQINPGILLNSIPFSFAVLLLYFTIENPDLKILNEVSLARDQAEKANRAKSDFLSSISHEIRTPLNSIVGNAEIMKYSHNLNEEERENIKDIKTASDTLLDIIENILDMNKIESGNLSINSVNYDSIQLFTSVANLFKYQLKEKNLDFKVTIAPDIPKELCGDKVNIKKIITNLLSNAIKYTKKGCIEYDIKSVISKDVCRLFITVSDTGRGIKKEDISRLFKKFERLDEMNTTIEGTGLGLAITQSYLTAMNGTITVNSEVGFGSRFVVTIDQKIVNSIPTGVITNYTDNAISQPQEISLSKVNMVNKRVFVVDDNKLNLKIASNLLRKRYNMSDETVISIENGQECIDRIKAGEHPNIIFMDDMMPSLNGQETFAKLKLLSGFDIPTVMLTANAVEGAKEMYLKQGFSYYLSKPVKLEDMDKALEFVFSNANNDIEN